ncbi:MAG TPA: dihydrodipicolinate synthase family protein [Kiloniellaceae bacterium]|nr:dihydrodipicolinate synthase family protein [Kiloniellaceae bacterium]
MRFEGIYPPIITPFRDDLTINWEAWAEVVEFLIAEGVHGIIVGGTTGEFYAMSDEERVEQLRRGKDIIAGRLPLIAGVNALNAAACVDMAVAAKDAGADALLLAAPPYSLPGQAELAAHCLKVQAATGLPVMLYNYPGRTGVDMERPFLDIVVTNPAICAIKDASGDIDRVHMIAREYPSLQLSIGAEDLALEFFAWGARSWVSPIPNFLPKPVVKLYEACALEGDYDKGRRLMDALLPISTFLERSGSYMQCVKHGCEHLGLKAGAVRPPLLPMDETIKTDLSAALDKATADVERILAEAAGPKQAAAVS